MIGFCKLINREVLSEADCYFCKDVDLTCCRYWRECKEIDSLLADVRALKIPEDSYIVGADNIKRNWYNSAIDDVLKKLSEHFS